MSSREVSLVDLVLHELRTRLTVAIGSLRQVGDLADPTQQAALARALRSCERLEQLASQMRDWTRLEDAPAEPGSVPLRPVAGRGGCVRRRRPAPARDSVVAAIATT